MRGVRAKRLRKAVYGAGAKRNTGYRRGLSGELICDEKRRAYKGLKRAWMN